MLGVYRPLKIKTVDHIENGEASVYTCRSTLKTA